MGRDRDCQVSAAAAARPGPVLVRDQAAALDGEYASDHWDASRLGVPARRGRGAARFDTIVQDWLREPVKRWSRFRLATGCAFTTINAGALAMSRFSAFLAGRHPAIAGEAGITRPVLEDYLSWLLDQGYSASTRALSLSMLRVFTDACHRHGWLPRLATGAVIYVEELPPHHDQVARFIPEFVMAQLESDAALSKIPHATTRHLTVVLIETGLRGGDACALPFNPVLDDSAGWPCLRFEATKVRAEQLIPLSARAAAVIRAQQDHVLSQWPGGSPWLFPGITGNSDGQKPYSHSSFTRQLTHWQRVIGLRDQAGQPVTVTGHQFRHTLGTRLINSGVPQHIVQKLLGHASPHMTAHYARVHDTTIREAFDRYQRQRVDITGQVIGYDPDAPTATAEWVKHNLSRVRDSLPNGYCGRPPQQDCPHPNACLTCPDFQTTPEFLDIHRRQAATNLHLITRAEASGQARLAANLRQVQANLEKIIPALETQPADHQEPRVDPR
jgi:integrase